MRKKNYCLSAILLNVYGLAQFREDYVVKQNGDTQNVKHIEVSLRRVCFRENDSRKCLKYPEVKLTYQNGIIHEKLYKQLVKRIVAGDINIYVSPGSEYSSDGESYRIINPADPKQKLRALTYKNIKKFVPEQGRKMMDSLLNKKDWTGSEIDIIKTYNKLMERKK